MGVEADEEKPAQDSEGQKQAETCLAVRMDNLGEFLATTPKGVMSTT